VISAVVTGASGDVRGVSWMTVIPDAARVRGDAGDVRQLRQGRRFQRVERGGVRSANWPARPAPAAR